MNRDIEGWSSTSHSFAYPITARDDVPRWVWACERWSGCHLFTSPTELTVDAAAPCHDSRHDPVPTPTLSQLPAAFHLAISVSPAKGSAIDKFAAASLLNLGDSLGQRLENVATRFQTPRNYRAASDGLKPAKNLSKSETENLKNPP